MGVKCDNQKRMLVQLVYLVIYAFPSQTSVWCLRISYKLVSTPRGVDGEPAPARKRGTKQCAERSIRLHSLATLIAVRILSPVHMTLRMPASLSSWITPDVVRLSLFSKMKKPTKTRSDSASERVIFCVLSQLSLARCLVAQAMTRKPL